jgi:nucleoid-associated protein YgaU
MKKTLKTTTTTPATPAPLPVKQVAAKPIKKAAAKPAAATPVSAKPVVAKPAVKATPSSVAITKVVAQIDVGFGNTLYIRGEGPGLSWEKGVPLDCVADDQWMLSLAETSRPAVFKFLINDLTWSIGDDYVVQPGDTVELTPTF